MRLLNAHTLEIKKFPDNDIPSYAILSHTWQDGEEVSFQDLHRPETVTKVGYQKIKQFCRLAITYDYTWVWVDTCCIDKTSREELSESINSMFKWYERSAVCFAYLADVSAKAEARLPLFANSRWFTRGWTLQELLAPQILYFVGSDWKIFGTRDSLAEHISVITGIGRRYLTSRAAELHYRTSDELFHDRFRGHLERKLNIRETTVAEKLSWAAPRQTTREEDIAYCLLGLCAVNMPLIYGEGAAAFLRLQETIIRHRFDPTILTWNAIDPSSQGKRILRPKNPIRASKWRSVGKALLGLESPWSYRNGDEYRPLNYTYPGILAPSPICFSGCDQYANLQVDLDWDMTSRGLSISLPTSKNRDPCMLLPCYKKDDPWHLVGIFLSGFNEESFDRAIASVEFIDRQNWQIWLKRRLLLSTYAPVWNSIRESYLQSIRIYVDEKLQCLDVAVSSGVYKLPDGMGCEWSNRRPNQPLFRLLIRSRMTEKTYTIVVAAAMIPEGQLRILLPESMHVRFHYSVHDTEQATGLGPVDWDNWERIKMSSRNSKGPEPLLVTIQQVASARTPEYLLSVSDVQRTITEEVQDSIALRRKYQENVSILRKAREELLQGISLLPSTLEAHLSSPMQRFLFDLLFLAVLSFLSISMAWLSGLLSEQIQCNLWCIFLCSRIYKTIAWAGLVHVLTYRALPTVCYLMPEMSNAIARYRSWIATMFIVPAFSDMILLPGSNPWATSVAFVALSFFLTVQGVTGYRVILFSVFVGFFSSFATALLAVPSVSTEMMVFIVGATELWIITGNDYDCVWFTVLWWYSSAYILLPRRYTEQLDCKLNPFALLMEDGIRRYQLSIYGQQLYGQ